MKLLAGFAADRGRRTGKSIPVYLLLALVAGIPRAEAEAHLDHRTDATLSGSLSSIGSESMAPLLEQWAEAFRSAYPGVDVYIQSSGSATAPPALADGIANLAPMSRMMNETEIGAFARRRGYEPTPVRVAVDAVMVVVHSGNPIRGLTLEQLDAVFSAARKCGQGEDIVRWGQLGLAGAWRDRPLQLFGLKPVSGTRDYFLQQALCGGDFKNAVAPQSDSSTLVKAVGDSLNAVGYAGLGYRIPGIRPVPLAVAPGTPFIEPNAANALAGAYPLTRYLYIYVDRPPGQPLPSRVEAFIRLALSERGQQSVARTGYIPLPASLITQELVRLQ